MPYYMDLPHPFWTEQRNRLIAESILTPQGREYTIDTLYKKVIELSEGGTHSKFYSKLIKIKENFYLYGRFY